VAGAEASGGANASIVFEICETGCVTIGHVLSATTFGVDVASASGTWSINGPGLNVGGGLILGDPAEPAVQYTITPGTYTFSASFDWEAMVEHITADAGSFCDPDAGPHNTTASYGYRVALSVLEPCKEAQASASKEGLVAPAASIASTSCDYLLKSTVGKLHVIRVDLESDEPSSKFLRDNGSRAGTGERIEDNAVDWTACLNRSFTKLLRKDREVRTCTPGSRDVPTIPRILAFR
jgi:hypothetical protein